MFVLANALVPLAALSLGAGVKKLRAPLAGVAAGVGGHLLLLFAGGFSSMWLAANALVCVVLARAAIKK